MSKWFISDLHLSHKLMIKLGYRKFASIEEMNKTIMENIYSSVKKGDDLYILGDLSWNKHVLYKFFDNMPKGVRIHLILGNHDKLYNLYDIYCESVSHIKKIKLAGNTVVMCHYPMTTWDKSHYNSWHLYGHHHINGHGTDKLDEKMKGKSINVNLEFHDFKPWSEEEIIEKMNSLPDNWDLINK